MDYEKAGLAEASLEFTATRTGALSWLLGTCLGSLGNLAAGDGSGFRMLEGPRQQGLTSAVLSLVLSCGFTPHFTGAHLISVCLLMSRPFPAEGPPALPWANTLWVSEHPPLWLLIGHLGPPCIPQP